MHSLKERFPIYSKLIELYPKKYQKEYGQQILQTTADMLDNSPSTVSKFGVWTHVAIDLPLNIAKQQLQYSGANYMKQTPTYIKRNSIISGLLLLPFFAALIANSIDKVINNHSLYGSWVWKSPFIGLWVLYLPLIAFLIAAMSYIYYLSRYKKVPVFKRLLDIKHSWLILLPLVATLGIMFILAFHDSVQCLVQTPAHFVSHISQTWQCTSRNQSIQVFKKLF